MEAASSLHYYRARYVVTMSGPVIEDGAVVVREGKIIAVGKNHDLRRHFQTRCASAFHHDLGEVIVMPGLINAHCHLDYTMMRGALASGSGFTSWIQELNKIKFSLREDDFLKAINDGLQELYLWGCTTVFNIESFSDLLLKFPTHRVRLWQFLEVMDIRGPQQGEEGLLAAEKFLQQKNKESKKKEPCSFGISPHAPQTASQGLYRGASRLSEKYKLPFCTHLAESEEEMEMFAKGRGVLFDFLKNIGRDMSDCGSRTPVQSLLQDDLLPRGSLLVHMNVLDQKDRELLARRAHDFFIVHCPKTHRFFGRPSFDWNFFYKNNYSMLLGTDSLASNDSFNLFEEMQAMALTAPELSAKEIFNMVTLHPAAAIGMRGRLGELSVGAYADLITIPCAEKPRDLFQTILHNKIAPTII